ncbi:MAG TPA: YdcF family protein [Gemmatimonadaceae bacterium]|nr:YdcF family protein [Gemmatimonadaceae bacterium]
MLLGALLGFLLGQLGFLDATGLRDYTSAVSSTALVTLILGLVRVGRRIVFVVTMLVFAAYLAIAFTELTAGVTSRWVRSDVLPSAPIDAIVVLSSDVRRDSTIDDEAVDRLLTGLELAKAKGIPRLVTTRTKIKVYDRFVTSDVDQGRLVHLAGLDSIWTVVDSVSSTRDEATHTARLLLPAGARTILVVTNPMHTHRACLTFEAVGFRTYCVPSRQHSFMTLHPWSPSDHLAAFRDYLYERLGMIKYRWKGWLPARPAAGP